MTRWCQLVMEVIHSVQAKFMVSEWRLRPGLAFVAGAAGEPGWVWV